MDSLANVPLDEESEVGFEAEYSVEVAICCSHCRARIDSVNVVRLLRKRVNFVSSLPRRGYIVVCPECKSAIPAALGSGSRLG